MTFESNDQNIKEKNIFFMLKVMFFNKNCVLLKKKYILSGFSSIKH